MTSWTVEIGAQAQKEIKRLPKDLRARFLHVAEMLEELGPQGVSFPHVRSLRDGLWEMRLRGRDGIARAIYFVAMPRRLVVVRAFVKKTQKTPNREIELALRRMKELNDGQE